MQQEYARELIVLLVENSARILRAQFGVDHAEPTFFQIVSMIHQYPQLKSDFLQMVRSTFTLRSSYGIDPGSVPRELIEIVAHEFRWPELLELTQARIDSVFNGDRSLARGDMALSVEGAFHNDWSDRDLYKRYNLASRTTQ